MKRPLLTLYSMLLWSMLTTPLLYGQSHDQAEPSAEPSQTVAAALGLSEPTTTSSIAILNKVLSQEFILYTKTLNFHWNVIGSHFAEYHKFFENQYKALAKILDDTAERIRSLGGHVHSSCAEFLQESCLQEHQGPPPADLTMMQILCKDHEELIRQLRTAIEVCNEYNDATTANFLIDLMSQHEKMAWMLRAFNSTHS